MHQLLATLFAVLLSFGHHAAGSHPLEANNSYNLARPTPVLSFPGRQDRARNVADASYAGSACNSCQLTRASFSVR